MVPIIFEFLVLLWLHANLCRNNQCIGYAFTDFNLNIHFWSKIYNFAGSRHYLVLDVVLAPCNFVQKEMM